MPLGGRKKVKGGEIEDPWNNVWDMRGSDI